MKYFLTLLFILLSSSTFSSAMEPNPKLLAHIHRSENNHKRIARAHEYTTEPTRSRSMLVTAQSYQELMEDYDSYIKENEKNQQEKLQEKDAVISKLQQEQRALAHRYAADLENQLKAFNKEKTQIDAQCKIMLEQTSERIKDYKTKIALQEKTRENELLLISNKLTIASMKLTMQEMINQMHEKKLMNCQDSHGYRSLSEDQKVLVQQELARLKKNAFFFSIGEKGCQLVALKGIVTPLTIAVVLWNRLLRGNNYEDGALVNTILFEFWFLSNCKLSQSFFHNLFRSHPLLGASILSVGIPSSLIGLGYLGQNKFKQLKADVHEQIQQLTNPQTAYVEAKKLENHELEKMRNTKDNQSPLFEGTRVVLADLLNGEFNPLKGTSIVDKLGRGTSLIVSPLALPGIIALDSICAVPHVAASVGRLIGNMASHELQTNRVLRTVFNLDTK